MKNIFHIIIISTGLLFGQTAEQIKKAKEVIQRTGMSESQARDAAKARGFTDKQIDAAIQKEKASKTGSGETVPEAAEKIGLPELGKSNEVISAIQKGKDIARRNIVKVPTINGTVPHKIIGKHGASRVIIKPAAPGTGIIAGGGVRAVMEQVGIHNVLTKRYGSKNSSNMVFATMDGLLNLKDAVAIANKRGIKIGEVFS